MVLSSGDQAIWRTPGYSVDFDVYVHAPAVVLQAQLLSIPLFPAGALIYDTPTIGVYTDVQAEMTVLLGTAPGGDDLGRTRIREYGFTTTVASSGALYIQRSSRGNNDGEIDPFVGCWITVLDLRMIWSTPPFITVTPLGDSTTYKDGDKTFNRIKAFRPVPVIGGDRLYVVDDPGDTVTASWDASDSYVTHPDASSIVQFLWSFPGGTPSSSGFAASGNITLAVGAHYIKLNLLDDLGNQESTWRLVVVATPDMLLRGYKITQHTVRADGQEISLQLDKPLPYSTYPDGTEVLIRQRERYGSEGVVSIGGMAGSEDMLFAGWIQSESSEGSASRQGYIARSTLRLADAAGRYKTLPGYPLTVERRATATRWEHMEDADIDYYLYHLMRWHGNLIRRCDFIWSGVGSTYPFTTLGSDGQSLYEQIDKRAQAIGFKLTCNRHNQLIVLGDPNILPTAAQQSFYSLPVARTEDVYLEIEEGDWKNWSLSYSRAPRVHWLWGEAIVASTDNADSGNDIGTVFCVAPGQAPGQGLSEETSGEQLVVSSTELCVREGHRYNARKNGRMNNVQFELRGADAGIEPAKMLWVALNISADKAAPRGRTLASERFLPTEVQYSYDHRRGTRRQRVSFEREVEGTPALPYTPATTPLGQYPALPPREPYIPPQEALLPILTAGVKTIAAFRKGGSTPEYYITENWDAADPDWTTVDLSADISGHNIVEFEPDPFSPYYLGSGTEVNGWLFSTLSGDLYVHKINDIGGTPTLDLQHTFADGASVGAVMTERGTQGWVVMKYLVQTGQPTPAGVYLAWTTDGETWQSERKTTLSTANLTPGLQLLYDVPGKLYTDIDFGSGTVGIYESTDYSDTLTAHPQGSGLQGTIHRPFSAPSTSFYVGDANAGEIHLIEGGVDTDVTLTISGTDYIPSGTGRSLKSYDLDRDYMAIAGNANCAISTDRLATGTKINASDNYTACNFAGDDPDYTFWWNTLSGGIIAARNGSGNAVSKAGAGGTAIAGGASVGICNIAGLPDP